MSEELEFGLSLGEKCELEELEEVFQGHQEAMWKGICALKKIDQLKLWRGQYKSFKEYCEQRWGLTRRRIDQVLKAHDVIEDLPGEIANLITNERQARALADVPPAHREGVVRQAASRGPVTSNTIATAAQGVPRVARVERTIIYDDVGTPIPDDALPYWNRKQEAQDLLTNITRVKSAVTNGKESQDPFYMRVSNALIYDLSTVYQHLLEVKPYAVCTQCQGTPSLQPNGCIFCKNTGLISKHQWDTQSMKEVKEMRLKSNNARNGHQPHAT